MTNTYWSRYIDCALAPRRRDSVISLVWLRIVRASSTAFARSCFFLRPPRPPFRHPHAASNFRQDQQLTSFHLKLACQPRAFVFSSVPVILSSITSTFACPVPFPSPSFLRPPHLSLTCSNSNSKKTRFPTSALIFALFSPAVLFRLQYLTPLNVTRAR